WILRLVGIVIRGYLTQADHVASAHAGMFAPLTLRTKQMLNACGIPMHALYDHQKEAAASDTHTLLIAPTGSGKTEAALLWAAHIAQRERAVPRLFYTLPYQASMNAMYTRLARLFSEAQVGLVHGRSTLALYRRLMEEERYTPEEAARAARWRNNIARLHLPPVRVFSPYQMLKAAFQLKGYEALLSDYAQALFIFDEIHAYEPKRLAMILELMRFLQHQLGARFFIMSATFPTLVRTQLEGALGDLHLIRANETLFERFTRHRVFVIEGDLTSPKGIQRVLAAFQQGQSVLVACNTVARAQAMYRAVQAAIPTLDAENLVLVHGRFTTRDRWKKEQHILARTEVGRTRHTPVIVIATQVVEVSLNIDLDVLFSDPAPLDALVQRFGRINRKGRLKDAPVYVFTEPDDGQHIYDARLVRGTLRILAEQADGRTLHEGLVQAWLDEAYQTDGFWQDWQQIFDESAAEFRHTFLDELVPFASDFTLSELFDRLFDGTEVLPLSLEEQYECLKKTRPLEASELLVPISWGRWHQLRQKGRLWTESDEWPPLVEVPYSTEIGLDLDSV
ncbi:MAG: CRISPR-associated helicase Cas3', partial [Ardenticatenia bacterium]